ncbi:MAG: hypothetical protein AUG16_05010 [Thaumarchaeota archaeon 13_1_20CM_2_39_20]|nr:MAG: hypothetical protein AUG16_05010 [Thaumarchaeota archaeon 13_1_20CM_2_39_20]
MQRDHFYHDGQWKNLQDRMQAISDNGKIVLPYYAKDAHIVTTGPDVVVQILLDGKTIKSDDSGQDTKNGFVHISEYRLYNIVSSAQPSSHTIISHPGFQIYTFTFG